MGAVRLRLGQANFSLADSSSIVDIDHMVADRKFNEGYDLRSRSHINLLQAIFADSPDYFLKPPLLSSQSNTQLRVYSAIQCVSLH